MEIVDKLKDNLNITQKQIEKFDGKADSLIAIVSIVFAISLSMINVFIEIASAEMTTKNHVKYILLLIFSILYFLSFTLEMIFLISVIFPRKKTKSNIMSLTYYWDVSLMDNKKIQQLANKENEINSVIDQLRINSVICAKKHKKLVKAIWTMIPVFLFMFALFFTAII